MKRILTAYAILSFAAVVCAVVLVLAAWEVAGWDVPLAPAVMLLWLAIAGVPSCRWAHGNLARALGVRRQAVPELRVVGSRDISVGGVLADAVPSLFARQHPVLNVPDELRFQCGDVMLSETEMLEFLRLGWRRQMRGEAPLSRTYWCGTRRMERAEYEAHVMLLVACNLIHGQRRQGKSNRLRWPPQMTMHELRWRYIGYGAAR